MNELGIARIHATLAMDSKLRANEPCISAMQPTQKNPWLSLVADHRGADRRRYLVELIGFEPTTSALQGRRSPN